MYCVKCGVELADSQRVCPLCGTRVFHPDIPRTPADPPYPPDERVHPEEVNRSGVCFILTVLALLPAVICVLCDWRINGGILWSGYASGGILLLYVLTVLPLWFKRPNPVIFVPLDFAAIILYLLYIDLATGGHWFLTFAFPVAGSIGVLITTVVALLSYVRRGYLHLRRRPHCRRRACHAAGVFAEPDLRRSPDLLLVLLSAGRRGAAGGDADHHCRLSTSAPLPSPEVLPVNSPQRVLWT